MAERPQEFYIYRLIVDDDSQVLGFMGRPVRDDGDILAILRESVVSQLDQTIERASNQYKYHLRQFVEYDAEGISEGPIVGLTLARSVLQQLGPIVTENAIITGTSIPDNPLATFTHLIFFMQRHIVAVAYNSDLMDSQVWRSTLHDIFDGAAGSLNLRSNLRIEPIPQESEILETFRSFTLLTRLKVHLKLPNPELSRFTQKLFEDMQSGGIREYMQEMRNSEGLSQEPGRLPYAAAAMADAGYKQGEVTMEGVRDGKREKVITGQSAAHVAMALEGVRDFARGMEPLAQTKEGKTIVASLLKEINRVLPRPDNATEYAQLGEDAGRPPKAGT